MNIRKRLAPSGSTVRLPGHAAHLGQSMAPLVMHALYTERTLTSQRGS